MSGVASKLRPTTTVRLAHFLYIHATRQAAHFLYIGNIRPMRAHFLYIPRVSRGRALIFFTPERRRAHFLYMPRHSLVYPDTEYCQLGLLHKVFSGSSSCCSRTRRSAAQPQSGRVTNT